MLTAANDGHTRLSPKSNFDLRWNESTESAFSESKRILANATFLVHPDPSAALNITCDASNFAVGGVLQQYIDNVWQPLSFFSKKLNPAKTRYSAFDHELLAVYATIGHIRRSAVNELLGRSAAKMIYGTTLRLPGEFTQKYTVDAHTNLDNYSDTRISVCAHRATHTRKTFSSIR